MAMFRPLVWTSSTISPIKDGLVVRYVVYSRRAVIYGRFNTNNASVRGIIRVFRINRYIGVECLFLNTRNH